MERQGQWEEAIQHDREAIELNPDLTNTRFRLGRLLLKMNRKPEALAEYRAALQTRAR